MPLRYLLQDTRSNGRNLIVVLFILLTTLILPRNSVRFIDYELGSTWHESDLRAPFDFPIRKLPAVYQSQIEDVKKNVAPVFLESDAKAVLQRRTQLLAYFDALTQAETILRSYRLQGGNNEALLKQADQLLSLLKPRPALQDLLQLQDFKVQMQDLRVRTLALFDSVYQAGFIDRSKNEFGTRFVSMRKLATLDKPVPLEAVFDNYTVLNYTQSATQGMPIPAAKIIKQLMFEYVRPNYAFDNNLYQEELALNLDGVSQYLGKVQEGEIIIARGDRITEETALKLQSLEEEKRLRSGEGSGWIEFLGQLMVVSLLTLVTVFFLRINRREVFYRNKRVLFLFFIYLLMTAFVVLVMQLDNYIDKDYGVSYYHMIPLCMASILITVFFDDRIGFFSNIIISLLAGFVVYNSFEFFFVQSCAGSIAVFNTTMLRRRSQFFITAGVLFVTYTVAYISYNLYAKGSIAELNWANIALFGLNVLLTLGTYPMVYLFERLIGITSDLTYIELLDTDHPLLKELATKAPGTYQHSLQVANIAEEVAKKIGANALQVHVGALFHDIGKMHQPEYFTENQRGIANPHDLLPPMQSAEIIISHVERGVELARRAGLPEEIIEFIRTHHGTSRVEYFYRKYALENDIMEVSHQEELAFRYGGPLPTTKETTIVMIADSVEASSKSLDNPTPEALEQLVERIVAAKIADGQLIHARITFRDLNKIKREILRLLISIYHNRIKYPDARPAEPVAPMSPN